MCMIRLSAPDWCFFRGQQDVLAYYRQLAALGITGVEMVDPQRWGAAREAGLSVINLGAPGMTRGLNRAEHHAAILPEIRTAIDTAREQGIPAVIVFSGNREGVRDDLGIANCVRGLSELAPYAEQAGVVLLFEMLCAMDHVDYHADRSAFGFQVVRQVNSPAVRALYDIYHMFRMGENVLGDLLDNLDIIAHIHVAESPRRTLPVRGGEIDYTPLVREVTRAGYQGYWGLEFVPQGEALAELGQACALFKSYLS